MFYTKQLWQVVILLINLVQNNLNRTSFLKNSFYLLLHVQMY